MQRYLRAVERPSFVRAHDLGTILVNGRTKFKYNPAQPTPQGIGDFEVMIV